MKRYFLSIAAVIIALGAVAFTEVREYYTTNYFWYKRTAADTYVEDRNPNVAAPAPLTTCSGSSTICVKGFEASQTPSNITDATLANAEQKKTP